MQRKSRKQEKNEATRPMMAQATTKTAVMGRKKWYEDLNKDKIRKFLLGSKDREGFLKMFFIYALLICIGFIFCVRYHINGIRRYFTFALYSL